MFGLPLSLSFFSTIVCTFTKAGLSYTLIHSEIALPQFMTWINLSHENRAA